MSAAVGSIASVRDFIGTDCVLSVPAAAGAAPGSNRDARGTSGAGSALPYAD